MNRHEQKRMMEILRQAYLGKKDILVPDHWQNNLMARIHEMGPVQSGTFFLPTFEHLVWRLAPVTSLLMLGLAALSVELDVIFGIDLFQLFVNGMEELSLAQVFGL